jgi:hypothetical protein
MSDESESKEIAIEGAVLLKKYTSEASGTDLNNFKIVMPGCYAEVLCLQLKLIIAFINGENMKMVRIAGLEPAHLSALPPQSSVSANSTICAIG